MQKLQTIVSRKANLTSTITSKFSERYGKLGASRVDHRRNDCCCACRSNFLNISVIIAVFAVYTINTFFGKPNFNSRFLHCYFNDMFAMPLILAYTNLLIYWLGSKSMQIITPVRIGCLTALCVIVWEGITPMVFASSVRDMFDVVAYSFGAFCYFIIVSLVDFRRCATGDPNA